MYSLIHAITSSQNNKIFHSKAIFSTKSNVAGQQTKERGWVCGEKKKQEEKRGLTVFRLFGLIQRWDIQDDGQGTFRANFKAIFSSNWCNRLKIQPAPLTLNSPCCMSVLVLMTTYFKPWVYELSRTIQRRLTKLINSSNRGITI